MNRGSTHNYRTCGKAGMFLLLHRGDGKVGLAAVIYLKAGNVVPTGAGICCCLEMGGRED